MKNNGEYSKCIGLCNHLHIQNNAFYESNYICGKECYEKKDYAKALSYFNNCNGFGGDLEDMMDYCQKYVKYKEAISAANRGDLNVAINKFVELDGFEDSDTWIEECKKASVSAGRYTYDSYVMYYSDGKVVEMEAAYYDMIVKVQKDGGAFKRTLLFEK